MSVLRKLGVSTLLLLLLMTSYARSQKKPATKPKAAATGNAAWVESTLKKMTLREKLGQMLMPHYFGVFTSAESSDYKALLHQVEENHVGGFIVATERGPLGIERSQVYPTAVLTNELQRRAKVPLLIGADFESGTGMRLDEGTSFPSAMAIGATNDPQLAYAEGKVIALESRAAGVHWIFAPDADVNNNPDNPIINIRSFGEDPKRVADFVTQEIRGIEENGGLATAKHFPGHGDVSVDSHLALATVPGDRKELEATELVPFRAAIAADVDSIMPGHLSVPAFEPDTTVPATTSRNILSGLLRDEMKYKGLVVTDAMDMGGVTSLYPPGEAAIRAVEAGADVLLMPPVPDAAMEGLERAVSSGRLTERRIDQSVRRILQAKARLGLDKNRFANIEQLDQNFGRPEFESQAQSIADRGVTLLRDTQRLLPLDATKPLRVLLVSLSADADPYPGETIEPEIRWRVDSLTALRADTQFVNVKTLKLPPPDSYDVAIAALFVRVADRKGNVGIPDDQRAFVDQMLAAGKPTVVMAFGSPYLIERFPGAPTWLAEFATNDVSQRAAVRALFGQVALQGQIPVTVPGTVKRGDGMAVAANPMTLQPGSAYMTYELTPVFGLLDSAVAAGAFPGGVLAVGLSDQMVVHPFGNLTRDAKAAPVTASTIYDLASLTKVIVTTASAMMLVQQKRLDLDAPVARYLPEFVAAAKSDPNPAWRARITVRVLMLHDSGLPAHRDFYKEAKGYDAVLAKVLAEPLVHEPGTQVEYSDLGFIMLGEIIQRLTGETLEEFAKSHIFAPLGMNDSLYSPPVSLRPRIAPTEYDADFRKRLLRGEVHDENAWAMGGISGNAGLFSTAGDVAAFAQMLLNGGIYAHHRLLARPTIQQFTQRQTVGDSARTLGWDVPTPPNSSAGHYFSSTSFGHTGFTGTSLWIDPERRLFVVLLTNRVNPTRANEQIRQVRPAVHDAIIQALGLLNSPATPQ
ncbi:MAG: glycoside hydrolase family 3 N-terminal domain-containing protein [Candidatus Acidiferrales bacterium]